MKQAGDAAGLASRASGQGVPFALVSGRGIGRKILDPACDMAEFRRMLAVKRRQEGRITKRCSFWELYCFSSAY